MFNALKPKSPILSKNNLLSSFKDIGTNGSPGLSALALAGMESKKGTETVFVRHQRRNHAKANQWRREIAVKFLRIIDQERLITAPTIIMEVTVQKVNTMQLIL